MNHSEHKANTLETRAKRAETCNRSVTGEKRGKTYKRCKERENMQPVQSAGKHASGAKSGKICNRCKERENMSLPTGAKREEIRTLAFSDWLRWFPCDRQRTQRSKAGLFTVVKAWLN